MIQSSILKDIIGKLLIKLFLKVKVQKVATVKSAIYHVLLVGAQKYPMETAKWSVWFTKLRLLVIHQQVLKKKKL